MTSLVVERLTIGEGRRGTQALDAAADRVADVVAGRALWSADEGLAWDAVRAGDVVVLDGGRRALLAPAVRDQGAHAVWRWPAGFSAPAPALQVLERLGPATTCIDAYLLSWVVRDRRGGLVEHVAAAMPAAGIVAVKEWPLAPRRDNLRRLAWRMLVAEVVGTDRDEVVGGTLHPRPAIAAR